MSSVIAQQILDVKNAAEAYRLRQEKTEPDLGPIPDLLYNLFMAETMPFCAKVADNLMARLAESKQTLSQDLVEAVCLKIQLIREDPDWLI